jgi:two-component system invasion response regulator UvrY
LRVRVLVVDDHAVVRKGLIQILKGDPHIVVSGEAASGEEAMEKLRDEQHDLVVLDITMPGRGGLETLKQIKKEKPSLPVLVLSYHSAEQYAVRSIRAGASGYLTKDSAPEELLKAVDETARGNLYISPKSAEKLVFDLATESERPLHEALSNRELQVLCMIASGKTTGDIAEELHLSIKTVSTYRSRILEKMKMSTISQLTYYAVKQGLID